MLMAFACRVVSRSTLRSWPWLWLPSPAASGVHPGIGALPPGLREGGAWRRGVRPGRASAPIGNERQPDRVDRGAIAFDRPRSLFPVVRWLHWPAPDNGTAAPQAD